MDWSYRAHNLSEEELRRVDRICDDFERRLLIGEKPNIESYLEAEENSHARDYLFLLMVPLEIECTADSYTNEQKRTCLERFPQYDVLIDELFESKELTRVSNDQQRTLNQQNVADPMLRLSPGQKFGKYQVIKCIGAGSFGVVYHATDTDLARDVALKLARSRPDQSTAVQNQFLLEAQNSAGIKADGIATIYDLYNEDERVCIVQEFIEGRNLKQLMAQRSFSINSAVNIVVDITHAISLAHQNKTFHRDLKPSNVIIDRLGKPTIVDFGLAWKDKNNPNQKALVGTPNYMSPEQVRGEVNRTDAKTDIWSLGVILYEILTETRPFDDENVEDIFMNIRTRQPKPLCDVNAKIPEELNRIVLKCLSKKKLERYHNAEQLVDDLKRFLDTDGDSQELEGSYVGGTFLPRGLRSFSLEDSSFFLNLLPGPRARNGLPESVLFWKNRIENFGALESLPIGLIFGASGCGKSSFVRAGLIPQLSNDIKTIYVEATTEETEIRILKALRQQFQELPNDVSLPDAFALIRDNGFLDAGGKLLVVIDQFEQWLSSNRESNETQLLNAIRHCDGANIQTLLLIREDYWSHASRFMEALEIPIVQNGNCRSTELFDVEHSKKILYEYGKAYRKFNSSSLTDEESEFLEAVVNELSEDDRVVIVKLAMFAEAFRNKEWSLANLEATGGAKGVGVLFLNDTFSASTAVHPYRSHKAAAQACLNSLLPEAGSDLKGHLQSRDQLLAVSGYQNNKGKFDELMELLDKNLRLVTSTDPVATDMKSATNVDGDSEPEYFQLSHDYLVPILRRWIESENQRHLVGRVKSRMTQVASIWGEVPSTRYLPTWLETVSFVLLTQWRSWTQLQTKMMRACLRYYSVATLIGVGCLIGSGFFLHGWYQDRVASQEVAIAKNSVLSEMPALIEEWQGNKNRIVPVLVKELGALSTIEPANESERLKLERQRLNLALALAELNGTNYKNVFQGFETLPKEQVVWLARFLGDEDEEFKKDFRRKLASGSNSKSSLRKAIALAEWGDPKYLVQFALDEENAEELKLMLRSLKINETASINALLEEVQVLKMKVCSNPSSELENSIKSVGGAIGRSGAIVFDVDMRQGKDLLRKAFKEGYLPSSFRPFAAANGARVSITWKRNRDVVDEPFDECVAIHTSLDEQSLLEMFQRKSEQKWSLNDMSFMNFGDSVEYCGLWLKNDYRKQILELSIQAGAVDKKLDSHWQNGFQVDRAFSRIAPDGKLVYSVLWLKNLNDEPVSESMNKVLASYPIDNSIELPPGSTYADCHISPIDLTNRYLADIHNVLRRRYPQIQSLLVNPSATVDVTTAKVIGRWIMLLRRIHDFENAKILVDRVLTSRPAWFDDDLAAASLFSVMSDRELFENELRRLEPLPTSPGVKEIKIPLLKMRFAIEAGDLEVAREIFSSLQKQIIVLRKEYAAKPSAIDFLLRSEIRGKLILADGMPEDSLERLELIDEAVGELHHGNPRSHRYLFFTDDYDVARSHPGFQSLIKQKGLGYRISNAAKFELGTVSKISIGSRRNQLKIDSTQSLGEGFHPECASCQYDTSSREIYGRVVWMKIQQNDVEERLYFSRLKKAANLLAHFGRKGLKNEIKQSKYGDSTASEPSKEQIEVILEPVSSDDSSAIE